MSKFSGRFDFYDQIEISGIDNILSSRVYIGNSDIPCSLKTKEDCVPFYPHIINVSCIGNEGSIIRLSAESSVDIEERNALKFFCCCAKENYEEIHSKCDEVTIKELEKESIPFFALDKCPSFKIILNRIIKNPKADSDVLIKDVHLEYYQYYRDNLLKELEKCH